MNWTETVERYIREGRTVSGGKGSGTADSQRQSELKMQQQAFNTQQTQLAALTKAFSPYLSGQQGFNPQMMASMRSQFLNQNTGAFNQAGNQVRAALGARGEGTGSAPVGGTYGSGIASLMGAQAGSQAQGLLGLNVQNSQQALQNQFNAGNYPFRECSHADRYAGCSRGGSLECSRKLHSGQEHWLGAVLCFRIWGSAREWFGCWRDRWIRDCCVRDWIWKLGLVTYGRIHRITARSQRNGTAYPTAATTSITTASVSN